MFKLTDEKAAMIGGGFRTAWWQEVTLPVLNEHIEECIRLLLLTREERRALGPKYDITDADLRARVRAYRILTETMPLELGQWYERMAERQREQQVEIDESARAMAMGRPLSPLPPVANPLVGDDDA